MLRLANGGDAPGCWAKTWVDKPFCWSALGSDVRHRGRPASRHNLLCEVAVRLWRSIGPDIDLPTGAKLAERYGRSAAKTNGSGRGDRVRRPLWRTR